MIINNTPGLIINETDKLSADLIQDGSTNKVVTQTEKNTWNNKGTVTSVAIKMNGTTKGTVTGSGTIDLGSVITDISGKQNTLVSGSNIKTINGSSVLGSGNLSVSGLPAVTTADNGKILKVVNGEWNVIKEPLSVHIRAGSNSGYVNTSGRTTYPISSDSIVIGEFSKINISGGGNIYVASAYRSTPTSGSQYSFTYNQDVNASTTTTLYTKTIVARSSGDNYGEATVSVNATTTGNTLTITVSLTVYDYYGNGIGGYGGCDDMSFAITTV